MSGKRRDEDDAMEEKSSAPSAIMEEAQKFLASSNFESSVDGFVSEHADSFYDAAEGKMEDMEHKLEYKELHTRYLKLFEAKIEDFLDDKGYTIEAFYKACREAIDDMYTALFEEHTHRWFVEMLLACMEYEHFCGLMLNEARRQKSNRSRK